MKRVLVVCAHPGDEILGCGGTLALHVRRGDAVRVLITGDGWTSRVGSVEKAMAAIDLDVIERQSRAALGALGVHEVEYLRLPDNRFDTLPLLELAKDVERIKQQFDPTVVYTNSPYDLSVDQQKTFRAVVTACRPQPRDNHTDLLCFEVPSSTEWNVSSGTGSFAPNYFVDIDATLSAKLAAFQELSFEVRPWPHPRSTEAVEHQARSRGSAVGLAAAETFMLLRAVRSGEP
jgi:LmbE family N-acetylglucosaminyl deacetylase